MSDNLICVRVVEQQQEGERLDVLAAEAAQLTRSRAGNLIREGRAQVNGVCQCKAGLKLRAGDEIRLELPPAEPAQALPQQIPLNILYQDDDLAVVYKPSGMVVHPAAGNPDGTLVNALLAGLDQLSGILSSIFG